jgi:hypothetical protein
LEFLVDDLQKKKKKKRKKMRGGKSKGEKVHTWAACWKVIPMRYRGRELSKNSKEVPCAVGGK